MSRVLVIGERANAPRLTDEEVARYRDRWCSDRMGVRAMLGVRTLTRGVSLRRLENVTGLKREDMTVVNLLWPDNRCGTWAQRDAVRCWGRLRRWLLRPECEVRRVLCLGSRVTRICYGATTRRQGDVWWIDRPMGSETYQHVPFFYMPHPSGSNRFWNSRNDTDDMTRQVREFLKIKD